MLDAFFMFAALIVSSLMVGYMAFVGRAISRAILVLLPATTMIVSGITLLADTDDDRLPLVALAVVVVAIALMCVVGFLAIRESRQTNMTARDTGLSQERDKRRD